MVKKDAPTPPKVPVTSPKRPDPAKILNEFLNKHSMVLFTSPLEEGLAKSTDGSITLKPPKIDIRYRDVTRR